MSFEGIHGGRQPQVEAKPTTLRQSVQLIPRWALHVRGSVEANAFAEIELLLLTFCTGIQDATTVPDYHCFASNQTGNTVMLAMTALIPNKSHELFVPTNIGVSLTCFVLAGWMTGQLGHRVGSRSRLWLIFSNFLQTTLVFGAAALQLIYGVQLEGTVTLIVIGMLAFASGSQVVLSRAFAMTEISTAMATAAWVDLMVDKNIFAPANHSRTRRLSFIVTLFIGALAGAAIYRAYGSAWAILASGVCKVVVTIMFLFNRTEKAEISQSELC